MEPIYGLPITLVVGCLSPQQLGNRTCPLEFGLWRGSLQSVRFSCAPSPKPQLKTEPALPDVLRQPHVSRLGWGAGETGSPLGGSTWASSYQALYSLQKEKGAHADTKQLSQELATPHVYATPDTDLCLCPTFEELTQGSLETVSIIPPGPGLWAAMDASIWLQPKARPVSSSVYFSEVKGSFLF